MKVSYPGRHWAVHFNVPDLEGEILTFTAQSKPVLTIKIEGDTLYCVITTATHTFKLEASLCPSTVVLEWLEYSIRLYADGKLVDEEWPLGLLPEQDWEVSCPDSVKPVFTAPEKTMVEQETSFTGPMQYFGAEGSNTGVGDCMPFARDGRYCLYYLFDRRSHQSKNGLGAHQWAQISSSDLKTWTVHPMALPITQQWEGSICTGSLIQKDGITYAFYAVRMSDRSPARMTWAVSDDGINFKKSGEYFALTEPYEPVSARDPMVFLGEDGLYHMLVTTNLPKQGRYGGCLAHLTSPDLHSWTQLDPFIIPGLSDQPECSDYFEWNGWYYLVFSNFATTRYRMSKSPFGPWTKPKNDILDSVENQVAKTAAFGNRRLVTGFLARYPRGYAGNAITHELFQRDDGSLGVCHVPEILPDFRVLDMLPGVSISSQQGRTTEIISKKSHGSFRLRAKLSLGGVTLGGFLFTIGGLEHRLDFDPASRLIAAIRPDQHFNMGDPRLQLKDVCFDKPVGFDMIVYDDILDLVLESGQCLTMRLNASANAGCSILAYAQDGVFTLKDIEWRH